MRTLVRVWICLLLGGLAASAHAAGGHQPGVRDQLLALQAKASGRLLGAKELGELARVLDGGVPTEAQVGCEGINALGPIVLASRGDRKLQRMLMDALYERVGDDVTAQGYAELADRVALSRGKKPSYGAMPVLKDGALQLQEGLDDMSVNQDRDDLGLAPIAVDLRTASDLISVGVPYDQVIGRAALCQPPPPITHSDLRRSLDERYERDQRLREMWDEAGTGADSTEAKAADADDAENAVFVSDVLRKYGFPDARMVGRKGVRAFYTLVQHSHSPDLIREALGMARPLMLRGEMARHDYALMIDRLRMYQEKDQIYGSQVSEDGGKVEAYPIQDRATLDRRREIMEMEPFDAYLRSMQSE
ncbi:hypothetical protein DYQ91_14435 [Xanthomonas sp. LMG 8989]|nr:hypothetical protein [Xanthomonas sp. LMG 8989]